MFDICAFSNISALDLIHQQKRTLTKHHYIDIDSHLKLNHIEYYVGGSSNFLMLFTTSLIILLAVKWLKLAMVSSLSRGTKIH